MNLNELKKNVKILLRKKYGRSGSRHYTIIEPFELFKLKFLPEFGIRFVDFYRISQEGDHWEVSFYERNELRDKEIFNSEKDACLCFLNRIKKVMQLS